MKKLLFLFCALRLTTSSLWAYDFVVDGIYYYLNYDGTTVSVTYRGEFYDSYNEYSGSVTIPSSVTYNGTTYSVTTIDGYAFRDCSGLTSVTIPNSVTMIGYYAFSGCTGLTSIIIPNSVTTIVKSAFSGCTGLTSVTIGNSVTSIGDYAFYDCEGLTTVNFNATNCTSMGSSSYPVFNGCTNLTTVTIGEDVTTIPNYAFSGCSGLTTVNFNAIRCESIDKSVFKECTNLTTLIVADSESVLDLSSSELSTSNLQTLYLGRTLTGVSFQGNSALKKLTIGGSVEYIESSAFSNCNQLDTLVIGDEVVMIRNSAFENCTALKEVTIGGSINRIGSSAFAGCDAIRTIYCKPTVPPVSTTTTFSTLTQENAILYVPIGTKADYQSTEPWKYFWDIQESEYVAVEDVFTEQVTVTVQNGAIVINGIDIDTSITIEVYNLHGQPVYRGNDTTIPVNERGIYIVRVQDRTYKVVL